MTSSPGPLAKRNWRLIPEESRSGPMHMALEEVAAETAVTGGPRTVRSFRWEPSTLSLGYRQEPESVDWEYCKSEGIDVTRRQTGGGGIYHDHDADISYSVIAPAEELPGDLMETYSQLCTPVVDAFERMGVRAAFAQAEQPGIHEPTCYLRAINPAHDLVAPADAGDGRSDGEGRCEFDTPTPKKLSGNAQYRQREAVIQHGSLSYDLMPKRHLGVFADSGIDADRFRERVTSVQKQSDITRTAAVDHLETALAEWADADVGAWTGAELDRARELAERKYESQSWLRDRTVADA